MIKKRCQEILNRYHNEKGNVTTILQDMQETFGYIPEDAVEWFSGKLNVPSSNFFGIATFYEEFYLKPRGKHIITACCDTACYVKGSDNIIEKLRADLNIAAGEDTSDDGKVTVQKGACVGACSIAPVVTIGKSTHGNVTPEKALDMLKDIDKS